MLAEAAFSPINWAVNLVPLRGFVGLLALCGAAFAQTQRDALSAEELERVGAFETAPALALYRPDIFSGVDSAVLLHGLPALTLLDGRRFPVSTALGRMGVVDLPVAFVRSVEVQKFGGSTRYGSDATGGVLDLRLRRFHTGGEVGFFYGRSDGEYGREDYSAHIIGGIGNDKFNITVGAAYSESSGRVEPRRR